MSMQVVKLCALPGGGSAAYAPAGSMHAGDAVTLSSKSKGERPGRLIASIGTIEHPFAGLTDLFTYKADK